VRDGGAFWRVEGSRNRQGSLNGKAEFFLSIEKQAGRILDIGEFLRFPLPPSVSEFVDARALSSLHSPVQPGADVATSGQSETPSSGAGMLLLIQMARGGVIFSSDLAVNIGELLCQAHFGDLARQAPLEATDEKEYWRVEGNRRKDKPS